MKTNTELARDCGALIHAPGEMQRHNRPTLTLTPGELDEFAEQIRADEREHCAAIAEQMTAHSRKTRAVLIGAVAPDCPVAAAIRNL